MVPNSTVITAATIFKSRLLKMAAARKITYLYHSAEVASKIKHAGYYIGINVLIFLKKKSVDEAEVFQCPFNT